MNNSVIGLDIAKHIFHLFTMGADRKILKNKNQWGQTRLVSTFIIRKIYSSNDCGVRGDSYCPRKRRLDYGDSHTLEKLGVATQTGQVNMLLISLVDKQRISAQMQFAEVAPFTL